MGGPDSAGPTQLEAGQLRGDQIARESKGALNRAAAVERISLKRKRGEYDSPCYLMASVFETNGVVEARHVCSTLAVRIIEVDGSSYCPACAAGLPRAQLAAEESRAFH
jgi:hypothetical protein